MRLHEFRQSHPYAAFLFVVLVTFLIVGIQGCAIKENRDLIDRQARIERQQAADRVGNRARFALSDRLLCQEIEKLKARDRKQAIENHKNLNRNLRILGITPTPEIFKLANETYRRALRETAPRKGGCGTLPPER